MVAAEILRGQVYPGVVRSAQFGALLCDREVLSRGAACSKQEELLAELATWSTAGGPAGSASQPGFLYMNPYTNKVIPNVDDFLAEIGSEDSDSDEGNDGNWVLFAVG